MTEYITVKLTKDQLYVVCDALQDRIYNNNLDVAVVAYCIRLRQKLLAQAKS